MAKADISAKCIPYAFSGANTGSGFVSFYDSIFPEEKLSGLYIIKGGSGTGKSTFMKRLGRTAEKLGFCSEYYFCGSDENSLDGIIIKGNNGSTVGVIDGTPPHPKEFRSPGAAGDILNFGVFWDSKALRARRKEIDSIVREKSSCFETAYRYLGAADKVDRHIMSLASDIYLGDKAKTAASRLVSSLGETGNILYRQLMGYTMNGTVHLKPRELDVRRYAVRGNYEIARLFLSDVVSCIKENGISAQIGRSPLNLRSVESVFFPQANVWLYISNDDSEDTEKVINTRRFIDSNKAALCRQRMRFGKKCRESLLSGALDSLALAKDYHFSLEEIYKEHMDFDALNKQSELWYKDILTRLD